MTTSITFGLARTTGLRHLGHQLQSQLSLIPAEHSRSRWELYDSAEGDLISASMILVCEERGLDGALQLRQLRSGSVVATAPLPHPFLWPGTPTDLVSCDLSEHPSMPPVAELPGGSLRRRLQTLLGDRRLGWLGALQVRQWRFDARNDADKTVARLFVEDYALLRTPGALAEACGKQLVLESLRGYGKPARRIEHMLRADLGLTPASHLLERALGLLGKLSGAAGQAKPEIDESTPAPMGVARALLWLLAEIEVQESGVQAGGDVKSLHDFRVAVRTTEVVSKQLGRSFRVEICLGSLRNFPGSERSRERLGISMWRCRRWQSTARVRMQTPAPTSNRWRLICGLVVNKSTYTCALPWHPAVTIA